MKNLKNTLDSFGLIAILFHWIMAIAVIIILCIGLRMGDMENGPQKLQIYGFHKSLGVLILMLVALRFSWRMVNVVPNMPNSMKNWEKLAAHLGHLALYFFMFAIPVSGWAMSSAAGFPVSFFGLFTLPNIVEPSIEARKFFAETHEFLAFSLIAVITIHLLAALYHQFVKKDNILKRMWS